MTIADDTAATAAQQTVNQSSGGDAPLVYTGDHTALFKQAMETRQILLPDGRITAIHSDMVDRQTDEDIHCDAFDLIVRPDYEHGYACFVETLVNAGLCGSSGSQRFYFVPQNLNLKTATGDLFDWNDLFYDRQAQSTDWRKEASFCDAFSAFPNRAMNRLKEKITQPRESILHMSRDDRLLWRMCFLSLARKVFLARAGFPEFCAQSAP